MHISPQRITTRFQSTPPRGRRPFLASGRYVLGSFNPRLREGGDHRHHTISRNPKSFNPRLREGGDTANGQRQAPSGSFNPRLREGGDLCTYTIRRRFSVSIHASAREATKLSGPYLNGIVVSIHASAREATAGQQRYRDGWWFQSTPPRGRRQNTDTINLGDLMFQSTPPRGRRRMMDTRR